uniref:Uncharacterized protein n=1 Tax=viral metagenome TaxID=1070528 RepID=A0A6M3LHN2_9ZZZZ
MEIMHLGGIAAIILLFYTLSDYRDDANDECEKTGVVVRKTKKDVYVRKGDNNG